MPLVSLDHRLAVPGLTVECPSSVDLARSPQVCLCLVQLLPFPPTVQKCVFMCTGVLKLPGVCDCESVLFVCNYIL